MTEQARPGYWPRLRVLIAVILLWRLGFILLSRVFAPRFAGAPAADRWLVLSASAAAESALLGLMAFLGASALRRGWRGVFTYKGGGRETALGCFCGIGTVALNYLVNKAAVSLAQPAATPINPLVSLLAEGSASGGAIAVLALILIVVTPIVEEAFFRGFIQNSLRERAPRLSIAVSTAVFANFHGSSLWSPSMLILGLVLSVLYNRTGSLRASTACHFVNNALAVLLVLASS